MFWTTVTNCCCECLSFWKIRLFCSSQITHQIHATVANSFLRKVLSLSRLKTQSLRVDVHWLVPFLLLNKHPIRFLVAWQVTNRWSIDSSSSKQRTHIWSPDHPIFQRLSLVRTLPLRTSKVKNFTLSRVRIRYNFECPQHLTPPSYKNV